MFPFAPSPWLAAVIASLMPMLMGCMPAAQPQQAAGDADRGQQLMSQYHCGECHEVPGVESARGTRAVTLEAFGRRSYIAGRVPNRPELLVRWIAEPASLVPGTTMPAMGVSGRDAQDIAAYLESLR